MTDGTAATAEPTKPADGGIPPAAPATDPPAPAGDDAAALKAALRTEREARKANEKRTKELEAALKALEDRDKTDTEKLTERVETSETRARVAETKLARYEAAARHGISADMAQHIVGDSPDEINASAEHLAAVLTAHAEPAKPAGNFDGGARTTPETAQKPELAHNAWLLQALGRQAS